MIFALAAVVLIVSAMLLMSVLGIAMPSRPPTVVASSLFRGAGPVISIAIVGVLVVVLGALMAGVVGNPGGGDASTPKAATTTTTTTITTTATTTAATTPIAGARTEIDRREVGMRAHTSAEFAREPPVVDTLAARSVLRVTATGFEPNTSGVVEQCTVARCANPFPVEFDATGPGAIPVPRRRRVRERLGTAHAMSRRRTTLRRASAQQRRLRISRDSFR